MRRRAHAVTVVLGALLAFMFGLLGASPASAVTPLYTYDAAAYRYDAPALLSSLDSVARDARVSPSGAEAVSWVSPASVRDRCVAADTAPGALSRVACFVGGTAVLMADGTSRAIEDVAVGDWVTAHDPATGQQVTREVVRTFVHTGIATYEVTLADGATVTTTVEHPFWVDGRGWTPAGELRTGERLQQPDGTTVAVEAVRATGRTATVYNFEVQGDHDYFVRAGSHWVLVHNICDLDVDGLAHATARHTMGGAERDALAGVFDTGVDLAELAGGSAGQIGMRNAITGNIEYVVRAPDIIGVTGGPSGGLPTATYTIVRNTYGELVTMFPGGG